MSPTERSPRKLPERANSKETVRFILDAVGIVLGQGDATRSEWLARRRLPA